MKKTYNTYKKSGVNMATADKVVNYISKISRKTYKKTQNLNLSRILVVLDQFLIYPSKKRVLAQEHKLYPAAIRSIFR